MRVYLIRHAQSVENARGLDYRVTQSEFNSFIQVTLEAPLSAIGLQQAEAVAATLKDKAIERLYCSPFARAYGTAEIVGQALQLTPQILPDLGEIMPARLPEGLRITSMRRHYQRGYFMLGLPGAKPESWAGLYRRAQRAWRAIKSGGGEQVVAVTHYAFMHILLANAYLQWHGVLHSYQPQNGGVTEVEIR